MDSLEISEMANIPLNIIQIGTNILSEMKNMNQFKNTDYTVEVLSRLSGLGLVIGGIEAEYDYSGSNFKESIFGREFISYILK
jgi:hypothetical protein